MGDIFLKKEAQNVLEKKHIVVIGGSNMRGLYKDIVWLLNDNSIIPYEVLGEKLEAEYPKFDGPRWKNKKISKRLQRIFHDDNRDYCLGGEGLHPGRTYVEPRQYHHYKKDISISFRFVTRVWSESLKNWLREYETNEKSKLDIIIMNSVLWDVNRWGPSGISEFKENLVKLLDTVSEILAPQGLFIWLTAQPGSKDLNSKAMEIPGLEFQKRTTRYNVIEANFYAAHKVAEAGFDVIDMHYYYLLQTFRRNKDGIHWSPEANRYATNLLLTHISLAYDKPLPLRNKDDYALQRVIFMSEVAKGNIKSNKNVKAKLKELDSIAEAMINKNYKEVLPTVNALKGQPEDENYGNQMPQSQQQYQGSNFNPVVIDYRNERPHPYMIPQNQQNTRVYRPQVFDYANGPRPWMGPGPMGPRPMGPGPMGPRPMGPGPMGPGPMGPGPIMGPGGRMGRQMNPWNPGMGPSPNMNMGPMMGPGGPMMRGPMGPMGPPQFHMNQPNFANGFDGFDDQQINDYNRQYNGNFQYH